MTTKKKDSASSSEQSRAGVTPAEILVPPENPPVEMASPDSVQATQGSVVSMAPADAVQASQGSGAAMADPEQVQSTQGDGETQPEAKSAKEK